MRPDTADVDGLYIGIVRVKSARNMSTLSRRVRHLGVGVGSEFHLGWRDESTISIDPDACRLVMIIRNHAQLDHAREMLDKLEGRPCLVEETDGGG